MIRNKNRSHGLNWIESWFIFPEEFLVRVGRLPRIKEQWETLQDNTHHQCWWYNQYSLKLLFLKTWWVTWSGCLSSANQSADVFFLFFRFHFKGLCFWAPARECRNHETMNHTSQQEGKTYAARGGGWVIFSGLAWGVKMSEVVLTKNQLSTPFMWKKTCGNLCWSLKCFEHQFFWGIR